MQTPSLPCTGLIFKFFDLLKQVMKSLIIVILIIRIRIMVVIVTVIVIIMIVMIIRIITASEDLVARCPKRE